MAYKILSHKGECILCALTSECAFLNQYSTCSSNNTHKYLVIQRQGDYTSLGYLNLYTTKSLFNHLLLMAKGAIIPYAYL